MASADFCVYEVCGRCHNSCMNPMYAELGDVCGECGLRRPERGWPQYVGRVCRWFLSALPGVRAYIETPDGKRLYTRRDMARAAGLNAPALRREDQQR